MPCAGSVHASFLAAMLLLWLVSSAQKVRVALSGSSEPCRWPSFSFSVAPLSAVLALVCMISTSYWQQLFSGGLDAIDDLLHAAQEYQSLQLGLALRIHQLWLSWLHVSLSSSFASLVSGRLLAARPDSRRERRGEKRASTSLTI